MISLKAYINSKEWKNFHRKLVKIAETEHLLCSSKIDAPTAPEEPWYPRVEKYEWVSVRSETEGNCLFSAWNLNKHAVNIDCEKIYYNGEVKY